MFPFVYHTLQSLPLVAGQTLALMSLPRRHLPFEVSDVVFPTGKTLFVEGIELSVHAMPIKYQPFYRNVKWTKQNGVVVLVAKRDIIKAGETSMISIIRMLHSPSSGTQTTSFHILKSS